MGSVYSGVPTELALNLRNLFKIECFFETGTYYGSTSEWAAHNFNKVITVEASEALYSEVSPRLKNIANIHPVFGNSPSEIARQIHDLPNTLFWLDAHWSRGPTAGEASECPLISELAVIAPYLYKHVILIDDARFFTAPPPSEHNYAHWPTLDEIIKVANSCIHAYTMIIDDVIIMTPHLYRSQMTKLIQQLGS